MRSSLPAPPPVRIKRKLPPRLLNSATAVPKQTVQPLPSSQCKPKLGIQGTTPTKVVPGTSLAAEEVTFLFWTLECYDDSKLQASLAAIRHKLGATVNFGQFVQVARLASHGMLSRIDVLQMCGNLSHGQQSSQSAEKLLLDTNEAFKALATRIRLLYLANALHRRRQQHDGAQPRAPPSVDKCTSPQPNVLGRSARSTRKQSAVEELRQELDRSKLAQQYFADVINAQAAQVSASCAVSASQVASKVALQLGLDKLANVVAAVRHRQVSRAFGTWQQATQLRCLEAEAIRWTRVYAVLCMEHALQSWRLRQLRRATSCFSRHTRSQKEFEQHAAAVELQRHWRGSAVRIRAQQLVSSQAAVKIQTAIRVFLARRTLQARRQRSAAARVIARSCQAFMARRRAARGRQRCNDHSMTSPDTPIATTPTQDVGPEDLQQTTEPSRSKSLDAETNNAAVLIQSAVRGWRARKHVRQLKAEQAIQSHAKKCRAAMQLQAVIRGWLCRCRYRRARQQRRQRRLARAAVVIQRSYRRHRQRRQQQQQQLTDAIEAMRIKHAAKVIQVAWRQFIKSRRRRQQHLLLDSDPPCSNEHHVRVIQRAVRRYLVGKRALELQEGELQSSVGSIDHERCVAQIVVIQSVVRMYLARSRISHLRVLKARNECHGRQLRLDEAHYDREQSHATQQAVRIQAAWRGWKGRHEAQQALQHRQRVQHAATVVGRAVLRYHKRRRRRTQQLVSLWSGVALAYAIIRRRIKHQRVGAVQAFLRAWSSEKVRATLIQTMKKRARHNELRWDCAARIQRMARGLLVRRQLRSQRYEAKRVLRVLLHVLVFTV